MKSAGNRGVVHDRLQVLHVHVFLVAPLGACHMAQPRADQHQGRVAVRERPYHSRPSADLTVQPLDHVVGADARPMLAGEVTVIFIWEIAVNIRWVLQERFRRINMDERFQYAEVRQRLIDALKTDLMGPQNVDEVLDENPMFAYIIGMLYPQTNTSADGVDVGEQEVEADIAYEDGEDYTSGEEDDNEPVAATKFKQQSSIGLCANLFAGSG